MSRNLKVGTDPAGTPGGDDDLLCKLVGRACWLLAGIKTLAACILAVLVLWTLAGVVSYVFRDFPR